MSAYDYRAFISYTHADRRIAGWLHERLESYRPPPSMPGATLGPIFRDRDEFSASGDLSSAVDAALERSEYLIVICSPAATRSRWVNEEILRFKAIRGESRVIPLIVAGAPFSDDPARECFPEALRHHVDSDGTMDDADLEPLAADLHADGRRRAMLKIAATLLGVDLDRLVQRDHARQVRRLAIATSVSLAGLVVAVGLAFTAYLARDDARAQREDALAQRAVAEASRAEAEGLVEFMLTDLRGKLEGVGRLELLEDIGRRAQSYYRRMPPDTLDEDSLARNARSLLLIGEMGNLRGDMDEAVMAFAEAHATTAELLERSPDDPDHIYGHAQSAFWLGLLDWQRGRVAPARRAFEEYEELARRLVTMDPERVEWRAELGYAQSNLGTLHIEGGRFAAAERAFRSCLELFEGIARELPEDVAWQIEVAQSHGWLADAMREQLRLDAALEARGRELAIYREQEALHPDDRRLVGRSIMAYRSVGNLELARGRPEAARAALEQARVIAEDLRALDADNTLWMDISAGVLLDLADLHLDAGFGDPQAHIDEALELSERLIELDPDVLMWHVDDLQRARLYGCRAAPRERVGACLEAVITELVELARINPRRASERLAEALSIRAGLLPDSGARDWETIVQLFDGAEQPRLSARRYQVEALLRTGRAAEAAPMIEALRTAGYAAPHFARVIAAAAPRIAGEGGP